MDQPRTARWVRSVEDVLDLLDRLFEDEADRWPAGAGAAWWDGSSGDRSRSAPFFGTAPDESLVAHLDAGLLAPRRVLDLGCGAAATRCTSPPAEPSWTPSTCRTRR